MWTIFTGSAEDPGPIVWDIFCINYGLYSEEIERKMEELGISEEMPQVDDNAPQPYEVNDLDAALSFLRSGGALCKVPDSEGSNYWRLLVIEPLALADVFLRLIAFDEADRAIPVAPLR